MQRREMAGHVIWSGTLNGEPWQFVTDDPTLVLTERGIADGKIIGVEVVDQNGLRRAWSARLA